MEQKLCNRSPKLAINGMSPCCAIYISFNTWRFPLKYRGQRYYICFLLHPELPRLLCSCWLCRAQMMLLVVIGCDLLVVQPQSPCFNKVSQTSDLCKFKGTLITNKYNIVFWKNAIASVWCLQCRHQMDTITTKHYHIFVFLLNEY